MSIQNNEADQVARLAGMLKWKKSNRFYAKKFKVSEAEIKLLIQEARAYLKKDTNPIEDSIRKENLEKGTIESILTLDFEPKDHIELAALHRVDLTKFVITNYWSKIKANGKFTSSLFCKRKTPNDYTIEDFTKFLENYKSPYVKQLYTPKDRYKDTVDMEMSIADYHLAKKYVNKENSIEKRAEDFYQIAADLMVQTTKVYNVGTVVFPISNDFFHTDTYWNTTTKGTPQDVIASYDEEYEVGFDVLVRTITMLLNVAEKVIIVLVQGNHDKTKSFYLAHALGVYFRKETNISFLRETNPVKYVTLGNTFIGYHHGNCKIDELPLIFATGSESSSAFGNSKFREVHTGDKHHYMAKEVKGVRIQQMPSLSDADRWHLESNYVNNIRAALVLLYHKVKGKCGEFEERL